MDTLLQVRMDSKLKTEVEELYRSMGISFDDAVRMFAEESLRVGGMPFHSAPKYREDMTYEDIVASQSKEDLSSGHFFTQTEMNSMMDELFRTGSES